MITTASRKHKIEITNSVQFRIDPNTNGLHLHLIDGNDTKTIYIRPEKTLEFAKKIIDVALTPMWGSVVVREGDRRLNDLVIYHTALEEFIFSLIDAKKNTLISVSIPRISVMYLGMRILEEIYNRQFLGEIHVGVEL